MHNCSSHPSKLLANPSERTVTMLAAVAALCLWLPAAAQTPQPGVNPQGATIKAFLDRVNAYLVLQKKASDGLARLAPSDDPSKMDGRQQALAARIRLARQDAKPGDVFGDAAAIFREIIRQDASDRAVRDQRAAMDEVPPRDPLRVNADYPKKSPLATVPPLILTKLPRLPEGVEYRFMGHDFVIRDVNANLIVDFIDNAVAPIKK